MLSMYCVNDCTGMSSQSVNQTPAHLLSSSMLKVVENTHLSVLIMHES